MTKFTKGEWIVYDKTMLWGNIRDDELIIGMDSYNKDYADHYCSHKLIIDSNDEESRANAHLIAAAPEMYRELEVARDMLNNLFKNIGSLGCRSEANRIDLLLAEARGE